MGEARTVYSKHLPMCRLNWGIGVLWVLAPAVMAIQLWTAVAVGYTGGPVHAELVGYDPTEKKVYYRLQAFDESGEAARIFYFDLSRVFQSRPVRKPSLEQPSAFDSSAVISRRWTRLAKRLVPLHKRLDFHIDMEARLESLRVDPFRGQTVYRCRIELRKGKLRGALADTAFCRPVANHDAPYQIPGRPEMVVIVSFIGRPYGCEYVDVPVLIAPPRRGKVETR